VKFRFWGPVPQTVAPSHIWFGALRSGREGAPYGENSALIRQAVPEIWRPKLLHFRPPSGETGSGRGQVTSSAVSTRRGLRPT